MLQWAAWPQVERRSFTRSDFRLTRLQANEQEKSLADLVPAAATIKTAAAQQKNDKNDDQNCGDIHMHLLSAASGVRRSPLLPYGA